MLTGMQSDASPSGAGRVLLVEDDERVGNVTCRLLERCGWQTVHVTTGQEALAQLEDGGLDVDVALVDYELPDQNGDALAVSLRAKRPQLRIIMTTGHPLDPGQGVESVLRKPYGLADLREVVGSNQPG